MSDYLQVVTTTETKDQALQIATALVDERLAACVQVVGPVTSTYRWEGTVQTSEEWLCVAKTRSARYDALERAIGRLHTYDVPEIIATPITAGSGSYLDWLRTETEPRASE